MVSASFTSFLRDDPMLLMFFFASLVVQNYLDTAIRLTDYGMADYG
jgi:hypothetical protein